ncbi:hypothetical protein [Kibdelosporangium aridum]|uniref:DUF4185 domain-containing protein n=1 Tax=Kibdelosporangium aridum TaxID=2030 RepID=A0A1W2F6T5_KIBAR|nr:hypothetical protein [Kibdelosporangium aridum]SMD17651.1 hypothetical protein SAMN05661093_05601 [Kibdelosporangium aridum]
MSWLLSAVLMVFSSVITVLPVKVTSNFENYWGVSLNRDCGFSEPLDNGQALWLFCDTAWSDFNGSHFVSGSTAAVGPYSAGLVPTELNELSMSPGPPPKPPHYGSPSQFLPAPAGLLNPSGQPCTPNVGQYPASWITGIATVTPDNLLVTYADLCVTDTEKPFFIQGFGIAEYNPANNAVTARTTVFSTPGVQLPAAKILGSPIYTGGFVYLYGFECTNWFSGVCVNGSTNVARTDSWRAPGNYQWYSQGAFVYSHAQATNIIPSAAAGVSVHRFGSAGLHAILQKDLGGGFEVWRAATPVGPWIQRSSGKVACSGGSGHDLCRALTGHPELSTADHMMISYFNPGSGHVEAALVPWDSAE